MPIECSQVLSSVRNPLDVIVSFFNLFHTTTQSRQVDGDYHVEFKEEFEKFAMKVTKNFKEYYEQLIKTCKDKNIPLYFIRYEDMLTNKL